MPPIAIQVEHLSKRYRIGRAQARYGSLREGLAEAARAPFRRRSASPENSPDAIWALKDVSFEIPQGQAVGIIGRNGAGKSTLLKVLARITRPTEGRVRLRGRVGSLLEVGTGFHPELTGRENIQLNGAVLGMKRAEINSKFDEIVAFSEIEQFLDTPVKHYSSGMYMRLAFAVAAHLEPEILLVDEVLAVGDVEFQKKCLGKMGQVAGEGRTVLFVSHNLSAVLGLCGKSLLLQHGQIGRFDRTAEVIETYLSRTGNSQGVAHLTVEAANGSPLQFHTVQVQEPGKTPSDQIALGAGAEVQFEYELGKPVRGANIALHLWNSQGLCVLTTTDVDIAPESIVQNRPAGRYQATCLIPSYTIRPGRYYIDLSASIPGIQVLANLQQVLSFDVVDTGSIESRLAQGRQGVIAPILAWRMEKLA